MVLWLSSKHLLLSVIQPLAPVWRRLIVKYSVRKDISFHSRKHVRRHKKKDGFPLFPSKKAYSAQVLQVLSVIIDYKYRSIII